MVIRRISHKHYRKIKPTTPSSSCHYCHPSTNPTLPPETGPQLGKPPAVCSQCVMRFRRILTSYNWRVNVRRAYFANNPFCISCPQYAFVKATDIDHIKPWRYYPSLFWDQSNWQPLCHSCHSKKTIDDNPLY